MCSGTTSAESDTAMMERLAAQQKTWAHLSLERKIEYLELLLANLTHDAALALGETSTPVIFGQPKEDDTEPLTDEYKLNVAVQTLLNGVIIRDSIKALLIVYKANCENEGNKKESIREKYQLLLNKNKQEIEGQTVLTKIFPIFDFDKWNTLGSDSTGEAWLNQPASETVRPFDLPALKPNDKTSQEGLRIVLGAGNQTFLSLMDCLEGLFVHNQVVLLKHHPLRGPSMDSFVRTLFAPLIKDGFFDAVMDQGVAQCKEMIHHKLVKSVHMTGGKATHDAIVWGDSKQRKKPVLQADMTSELGCVTPWIVVPSKYSAKELKQQASVILTTVHTNASCNCNAPKVLVVAEDWAQKDEFLNMIQQAWRRADLPVAYYPGTKARWEFYQKQYPDAKVIPSDTGRGAEERRLSTPMLGKEGPVLLPLLWIEKTVDLSTDVGRKTAKTEHCFRQEPFAPVLTIATLKSRDRADYLDQSAIFVNEYLFGSLSCHVTCPPKEFDQVKGNLTAKLRYGVVAFNNYTGLVYGAPSCQWGAYPGEDLAAVESGIGSVQNRLCLPNLLKVVFYSPLVSMSHVTLDALPPPDLLAAVAKLLLEPSVSAVGDMSIAVARALISAVPGWLVGTTAVAGVAILAASRLA